MLHDRNCNPKLSALFCNLQVEQDTLVRLEMEKNILKDELVQAQIKAEELAEDIENVRSDLDRSQEECHKVGLFQGDFE